MKNLLKKLFVISLVAVVLTACSGSESDSAQEVETQSKDDKTITVAANNSFYPVIYTNEDGELAGFEHDVLEEIGKRTGYDINFEPIGDYSVMFEGLDSGKFDTIAGQISITDEREEKYKFSDPYCYNAIKLAVRGDDPANSVEDMQGRKVCIEFGTELETVFNKINEKFPEDKKIELVTTEGNIYEELKAGHYDGFPITVLTFDEVNEKGNYGFKLVGEPLNIVKTAFPFAQDADPEMIEAFNKALDEMRNDGTLTRLSEQYYKRDVTQDKVTE